MKQILLIVSVMILSACMAPPANTVSTPQETSVPALPATQEPTDAASAPTEALPNPKLPAAPFDSQVYINEAAGFALDYPTGWTVNEAVVGDRGAQVQFLSSAELADAAILPEGATRVTATLYQWDPKNDLAAFAANQKTAWESSGFSVLEEQPLTLELGLPATQFTVQTPDATSVFLVTALKDQYLVLSGEGNLDLAKQIIQRLRPIS